MTVIAIFARCAGRIRKVRDPPLGNHDAFCDCLLG
jgi:hypothetical protein